VEASHVDKKTLLCKICEAEEETIAQMNQEWVAYIHLINAHVHLRKT
jgi:hypothetical protein